MKVNVNWLLGNGIQNIYSSSLFYFHADKTQSAGN